jgi:hypothetical protein
VVITLSNPAPDPMALPYESEAGALDAGSLCTEPLEGLEDLSSWSSLIPRPVSETAIPNRPAVVCSQ